MHGGTRHQTIKQGMVKNKRQWVFAGLNGWVRMELERRKSSSEKVKTRTLENHKGAAPKSSRTLLFASYLL